MRRQQNDPPPYSNLTNESPLSPLKLASQRIATLETLLANAQTELNRKTEEFNYTAGRIRQLEDELNGTKNELAEATLRSEQAENLYNTSNDLAHRWRDRALALERQLKQLQTQPQQIPPPPPPYPRQARTPIIIVGPNSVANLSGSTNRLSSRDGHIDPYLQHGNAHSFFENRGHGKMNRGRGSQHGENHQQPRNGL